jgi:hypothetical protein
MNDEAEAICVATEVVRLAAKVGAPWRVLADRGGGLGADVGLQLHRQS